MALPAGIAYSFVNTRIELLGLAPITVSQIEYTETTDTTNNYGVGSLPTSRGYVTSKFAGSMTIAMEDLQAIRRAVLSQGLRSITQLAPFDIIVVHIKEGQITRHILEKCSFLNDGLSGEVDSPEYTTQLNFLPANIIWA